MEETVEAHKLHVEEKNKKINGLKQNTQEKKEWKKNNKWYKAKKEVYE